MIPCQYQWDWNCDLRRSPKWPGSRQKIVWSKILKSAIFELHNRYTPQKISLFFQNWSQIFDFLLKNEGKKNLQYLMIKIKKRIFQISGFLGLRCTDFFVHVEKVVGNRYPLAAGSCSKVSARITILTAPLTKLWEKKFPRYICFVNFLSSSAKLKSITLTLSFSVCTATVFVFQTLNECVHILN